MNLTFREMQEASALAGRADKAFRAWKAKQGGPKDKTEAEQRAARKQKIMDTYMYSMGSGG
jgi:hypothetical protein